MLRKVLNYFSISKPSLVLILIGTFVWSLVMVRSGIVYDYGMGFWGPNGHDGVWHIALINSLARGSWEMPIFAGEVIKNYHIGFDLFVAIIHKLTFIPVTTLYFQVLPPIMAFFIGFFAYKFVYSWRKSTTQAFWALFFIYFGGGFGAIVTLIRGQGIAGDSMFWVQSQVTTLINPSLAFSLLLIFLSLGLLYKGVENKNKKKLIAAAVIFGLLIQIKVYAGLLILGSLLVVSIFKLIKGRENRLIKVFLGALVVSTLVTLPLYSSAKSTFEFQPFWFLETMMAVSDRANWPKFYEAMINYRAAGNWPRALLAYIVAFVIFYYGNLGTRLLHDFYLVKKLRVIKNVSWIDVMLITIIVSGIVMPLLFVQKGTPWNTIQFMYYSLALSGIYAGFVFADILHTQKKKVSKAIIISVLMIFTLPTTIATMRHYLPTNPPAILSTEELEATRFLSEKPDGIVLTYLYGVVPLGTEIPSNLIPLYLYTSTSYVSAYADKPVFLEGESNLNISSYDWPKRKEEISVFYDSLDQVEVRKFLNDNDITYIYWIKGQRARLGETQLGIERIFENNSVDIYEVSK